MKVTLRHAAVLQDEIRNKLKTTELVTRVQVSEFTASLEDVISEGVLKSSKVLSERTALQEALYSIRASVAAANNTAGVNGKLAELALVESKMRDMEVLTKAPARGNLDEMRARLEKLRNQDTNAYAYGHQSPIMVGVHSQERLDLFATELANLKRAVRGIKDTLMELNFSHHIELSESTVATLKAANII